MDALLSAPAGVAILIEGSEYSSIHAAAPLRRITRRAEEIHLILGEASELQLLENVDFGYVVRQLEQETDATKALQLTLILLDSELPEAVRSKAADELNEILVRDGRGELLERVLYAHPLPPDADLSGALGLAHGRASNVHELLRNLEILQPAIQETRRAWDEIPDELFEGAAGRRRLQAAAVRTGLYKNLALAHLDGTAIDSSVDAALLNPTIHAVEGHRQAIIAWVALLRRPQKMRWERATEVAEAVAGPLPPPGPYFREDHSAGNLLVEQWKGAEEVEREKIFSQIYLLFYRKVYRFFVRRGFPDDTSKDLAQETFLRLYENLASFRGDARFETWLYKIAANTYKNRLRTLSTQKRAASEVTWEDVTEGELTTASAEESSAPPGGKDRPLREELIEQLWAAMADLPPQVQRCVMLRVTADLKYREIAEVLKVSIETVRAHLFQARQQLKGRLGDCLTELDL